MDDGQVNNDNLTERLNNLAQEHARGKQAKVDQRSYLERTNTFVSEYAQEEYLNLIRLLKQRAEEMNSRIGNLPQFVPGGSCIQLGNVALYYRFDQPIGNRPDINELVLSVGTVPNKMSASMFGPPPPPVRYKLQAAASKDFSTIVWVGNDRQFRSAELVEFALEQLTAYYLRHKAN